MNVRYMACPLAFILLLWPSVYTQRCDSDIPEDVLLEAQFLPVDDKTVYPEDKLPDLLAKESTAVQEYIKAAQAETMDTISDVFRLKDYYYDVCPAYTFLLPYKLWYFYNNKKSKCFAVYSVYITWCKTYYCNWNNNVSYWWNRCVQEWRDYNFWAVCGDQNDGWYLHYPKWRLPACCNCKRYRRYEIEQCRV